MLKDIVEDLGIVSRGLLVFIAMLILSLFILNKLRTSRLPVVSDVANSAYNHATGASYNQPAVVSVPVAPVGANIGPRL